MATPSQMQKEHAESLTLKGLVSEKQLEVCLSVCYSTLVTDPRQLEVVLERMKGANEVLGSLEQEIESANFRRDSAEASADASTERVALVTERLSILSQEVYHPETPLGILALL